VTLGTVREADVREWLMPFLLLCMRGGDMRGYELMGRVAGLGFGSVRPGEIYRTLRRAEEEGLVASEHERLGYLLSRRRYGLTEPGKAYIEFLADSMRSYQREIESFLRAYEESATREVCG
jgi:PadR family transcriptional regulator, regulatory protein PadR